MTAKIPLPTDDELAPVRRQMLAELPPLNVFRMGAGAPREESVASLTPGSIACGADGDGWGVR